MKRVAIRDVAAAAGVSRATVSNYLNRPEVLSDAARERIDKAVDELGFVPSEAARSIGKQDTRTIGYIATEFTNPFSGVIADAIERRAIETGYTVMIGNSGGIAGRQLQYLELFERKRVSGIIIASVEEVEPALEAIRGRGTPSVISGRVSTRAAQPSVSAADSDGGYMAVRHLLSLGRRRVLFVGGPFSVRQVSERFDGATRAIEETLGSSLQAMRIQERTFDGGLEAGVRIASGGGDLPDAVFAVNDLVGIGVVQSLVAQGIRVPEDIAVIGFDGDDIAALSAVPLSTIAVPADEIGRLAVDLLLNELDRPQRGFKSLQQVIEPTLVIRESTAGGVER